ncbi:MAG: branched-chain amino acid ABC transporter substrate-binding protein [Armatimonadota bacterium]|nr:branched-chain amino acid ABC transporter substrate-binding protein [Armatimonadota bacterium]MDR7447855.1 branched-chain amino acid ABC transporter substrate-binding protein [Armatimonadota bacterium]MDR7479796.1 branched-chain amino acid ABC transporter substrate-binding protein [Armatimonadota bacterium]MDR7487541.1 branched-chain amino acid ABC transporter substrate-binding protein [Armatimonadota bacterium]MDR7490274.1 branched-chain amino acid ABC transporter substrate-binding protein 
MRIRRVPVVLATVLTMLVLLVAGQGPVGAQQNVIKIATQSPLSGGQSVLGTAIKNGAQLCIEQQAAKILPGWRVQLVPFDDQAKPDVGVANAKNLVTDPDILLVVGHLNSGVAIPSSEVYKDNDLAMISPANTNPVVTDRGYRNVTRVVGRDDVQGRVGAEFAGKDLKVKSAYVIHDKTAYGQGVAEFFRQFAPQNGIRILGFEGTEETANFDPILTPIAARRPELIYFGGIYNQAGVFFKQARAKGITAKFLGPDGMDSSDLARIAGQAIVGMHYTTVAGPASFYPGAAKFAADYKKRFGADPEPFAVQAYESCWIGLTAIANAVKAAGGKKPTRLQVTNEVRKIRGFKGLTQTYTFDEKGDPTPATYFVIRIESADPAKWGQNRLVKTLRINPPPLKKK